MARDLGIHFLSLLAGLLFAPATSADEARFGVRIAQAAVERTQHDVQYDPSYVVIAYPGGDVPADRGVCTDVVIRSLRAVGVDLQQRVHEDMRANFDHYPKRWGLSSPDTNIDHRRVPNLETYFERLGAKRPASRLFTDYQPGDIVAWNLKGEDGYLAHIGVVTSHIGPSGAPMVVHNINAGPELEDVLVRLGDDGPLPTFAQSNELERRFISRRMFL